MTVNLDILKMKLCNAIDKEGNVLDTEAVLAIITQLQPLTITTEELEKTRLGKYVNLIRKHAKDPLVSKKARGLVKKWKQLLVSSKPEIGNGLLKRARREGSRSREGTPLLGSRSREGTPLLNNFDDSSRESTPMTDTVHETLTNGHASHLKIISSEEGVRYEKKHYPWSEPLVVTQEERELVILPYVCLD